MTSEEREEVKQVRRRAYPPLLSWDGVLDCLVGVFAVGSCLAVLLLIPVVLLYIVLSLLRLPTAFLAWLAGTGALGGALLSQRQMRKDQASRDSLYAQDLADRMVEVLHCTVLDAAEVMDAGGNLGYFLNIGDSRLLYLFGEEVEEFVRAGQFPNRELRRVKAPHSQITLAFDCLGEPFDISRQFDNNSAISELVPVHAEVLPGTLDTLEADLRRFQESQRAANG